MPLHAETIPSIIAPSYQPSNQDPPPTSPASISSTTPSDDETLRPSARSSRPKLGSRKSSGTMIIPRDQPPETQHPELDAGDVRAMSPRRSSEEVDRLGEAARGELIAQAQ
ncbi:hypothetical protein LTR53_019276, partial [Teratosphaeriaceae sp. CCFEE 6253]